MYFRLVARRVEGLKVAVFLGACSRGLEIENKKEDKGLK